MSSLKSLSTGHISLKKGFFLDCLTHFIETNFFDVFVFSRYLMRGQRTLKIIQEDLEPQQRRQLLLVLLINQQWKAFRHQ
jgi:hypothetical protein